MTTDTRSYGVMYEPEVYWKSWRQTASEPDTWTKMSWIKRVGRTGTATSERTSKIRKIRVGYRPRYSRSGRLKGYKPVYRSLIGPRRQPNPWRHISYVGDGYSWYTDVRLKTYWQSWTAFKGNVPALVLGDLTLPWTNMALVKAVDSALYQEASANTFDAYLQTGEMLETLQMLKNPLASLREAGELVWHKMHKRTRRLAGKDLSEAISGAWLEYAFGVSPLINGTAEIASSLVDALNPIPTKYRQVRSYVAEENTQRSTDLSMSIRPYVSLTYDRDIIERQIVTGGMWLCNDVGAFTRQAQLGLDGMRSIVSQAWALVPLSFAVDWFVGIGPLLDECRPIRGKQISSWRTVTREVEARYFTKYLGAWLYGNHTPLYGNVSQYKRDVERVINVTPPGTIQLGPGLFSLSQGMSLAALGVAPLNRLWRKLPWH